MEIGMCKWVLQRLKARTAPLFLLRRAARASRHPNRLERHGDRVEKAKSAMDRSGGTKREREREIERGCDLLESEGKNGKIVTVEREKCAQRERALTFAICFWCVFFCACCVGLCVSQSSAQSVTDQGKIQNHRLHHHHHHHHHHHLLFVFRFSSPSSFRSLSSPFPSHQQRGRACIRRLRSRVARRARREINNRRGSIPS